MEISELISLFANQCFPVVCCCVLFYQNNKYQETLGEIEKTISKVADRLEALEKGGAK